MTDKVSAAYLALAGELAERTGAIIRRHFRQKIAVEQKPDRTPVTVADREAEKAMREMIEARYPDHGIWGEEFGRVRPEADYVWVLDPIDGTKSFISGVPLFGTLIALAFKGKPVLGVIDQPIQRERWLGAAEPSEPIANRSLIKYKLIIEDFGDWALFQELLRALRRVADRRGADIASVASRLTLDSPGVAAVIVGATSKAHLAANVAAAGLALTDEDRAEIEAVVHKSRGPIGDVYELERDRDGRHGSIMKYNLNAERA